MAVMGQFPTNHFYIILPEKVIASRVGQFPTKMLFPAPPGMHPGDGGDDHKGRTKLEGVGASKSMLAGSAAFWHAAYGKRPREA